MADLTTILDTRAAIAQLDTENMLGSVEAFYQQVQHAWEDTRSLSFTPTAEIKNVVLAGMGGSGLGADVIKTLYKDQLQVPFDYVHDYTLPEYVNENTLVILASYSGTTEEVLAAANDAIARKAQIMVIAAGGNLISMAEKHHWTAYKIDAKYNPSQQPRMAICYAVFGTLALLSIAGILKLTEAEVQAVVATIEKTVKNSTVEVSQDLAPAKLLAYTMYEKRPVFIVSEFLEGAGHVVTNQSNENAKVFADYKVVPELNHHLMEGLRFPSSNSDNHLFIFLNSDLYNPRNQARMKLTQSIVEENNIETMAIQLRSTTKLEQVFETIALVGFAGFYLSILEGINPSPIPFVDKFKVELGKIK